LRPFAFDEAGSTRYNAAFPGQLAQLVEQRTENPRVRGSIPRLATQNTSQKVHRRPESPVIARVLAFLTSIEIPACLLQSDSKRQ
jgi:hypothetical protein